MGSAWVRVWNSYTAIHSVYSSPGTVSNTAESGAGTRYSPAATAHASGGTGSYTYAWTYHEGNSSITATTPSARSTTFQTYFSNLTGSRTAVFKVTISDGVSSAVAFVTIHLYNNRAGLPGGGGGVVA